MSAEKVWIFFFLIMDFPNICWWLSASVDLSGDCNVKDAKEVRRVKKKRQE